MKLSVIGRWNTERSLLTVGRILWGKGGIECDRKGYRAKFSVTLRRRFRVDAWREYDGWLADLGFIRLHYKWDRVPSRYEPTGTNGGAWGYGWIRRVSEQPRPHSNHRQGEGTLSNWTTVGEMEDAAGRLPRHEGAHAMALFRAGKWREAVAYVQERLSYYERMAA